MESAQDIIEELGYHAGAEPSTNAEFTPATGQETRLLPCLGYDPVGIDALVACSGLTSDSVCAILLTMELDGCVTSLPGGLYQQCGKNSNLD